MIHPVVHGASVRTSGSCLLHVHGLLVTLRSSLNHLPLQPADEALGDFRERRVQREGNTFISERLVGHRECQRAFARIVPCAQVKSPALAPASDAPNILLRGESFMNSITIECSVSAMNNWGPGLSPFCSEQREQAEANTDLSARTGLQWSRHMIVSAHEIVTTAKYSQAWSEQQHGMPDVPYDDLDLFA